MKQLNVVIPGLIWSDIGDYDYLYNQLDVPVLTDLLSKATVSKHQLWYSDFVYRTISSCSLAKQYAEEINFGGYTSYLVVEPTHLRADRDRLLIAESELLQLSDSEAQEIISSLNEHFAGEIEVRLYRDDLWILGCNFQLDDMQSYPIVDIVGENIDEFMPTGSARIKLHGLLNEIQMLLFMHPINQQRNEENLLAINSLWLWDKRPTTLPFELKDVVSNNSQLGHPVTDLQHDLSIHNVLIWDKAYYPAQYRDSFAWVKNIHEIETHLAPLLLAVLKAKHYTQLNIWIPSLKGTSCFQLGKFDLYKFWRRKTFTELSIES